MFTSISGLKGICIGGACGRGRVRDILGLSLISIRTVETTGFHITVSYMGSMNNIIVPRLLSTLKMGRVFGLRYTPRNGFTRGPRPVPRGLARVSSLVGRTGTSINFIISPSMSHLTVVDRSKRVFKRRCALITIDSCILDRAPNGAIDGLDSDHTLHSIAHTRNYRCGTTTINRIGIMAGVGTAGTVVNNRNGKNIVCPTDRCNHSTLINVTLFLARLTGGRVGADRLHTSCPPCFVSGGGMRLAPSVSMSTVLTGMGRGFTRCSVASVSNIGVSFPRG